MYSATPQKISGCAYMTYSVRYAAWLYPRLLLVDVPRALSSSLQSPPLGGRQPGIVPAGCDMGCTIPSWVARLHTAALSASMLANAMLGVAALRNNVAPACSSKPCPTHRKYPYFSHIIWQGSLAVYWQGSYYVVASWHHGVYVCVPFRNCPVMESHCFSMHMWP
jgi:hypothetical protein